MTMNKEQIICGHTPFLFSNLKIDLSKCVIIVLLIVFDNRGHVFI